MYYVASIRLLNDKSMKENRLKDQKEREIIQNKIKWENNEQNKRKNKTKYENIIDKNHQKKTTKWKWEKEL